MVLLNVLISVKRALPPPPGQLSKKDKGLNLKVDFVYSGCLTGWRCCVTSLGKGQCERIHQKA